MTPSTIQLIAAGIGIIYIAWSVVEMIKGKIRTPGSWSLTGKYFASNPIWFSLKGGFNLLVGLAFCLLPQLLNTDTNKPIYFGCSFAAWAGFSLLSYLIGYAGQNWRDSHGIERITDPNKFRFKFSFRHKFQHKSKDKVDPFS